MFITYRRVGIRAVLPTVVTAGILVIVAGIAAAIAVIGVAVLGVVAVGARTLQAFGLGGSRRRRAVDGEHTIEGVVVTRSSVVQR
jgi:hypothetical protein